MTITEVEPVGTEATLPVVARVLGLVPLTVLEPDTDPKDDVVSFGGMLLDTDPAGEFEGMTVPEVVNIRRLVVTDSGVLLREADGDTPLEVDRPNDDAGTPMDVESFDPRLDEVTDSVVVAAVPLELADI